MLLNFFTLKNAYEDNIKCWQRELNAEFVSCMQHVRVGISGITFYTEQGQLSRVGQVGQWLTQYNCHMPIAAGKLAHAHFEIDECHCVAIGMHAFGASKWSCEDTCTIIVLATNYFIQKSYSFLWKTASDHGLTHASINGLSSLALTLWHRQRHLLCHT